MRHGRRVSDPPALREAQERFTAELAQLPPESRRITGPLPQRPVYSDQLKSLADQVRYRIESEILTAERV
jgi:nicotinate phosphoribosyltransferase